jgi:hypothetical protein
VEDLSEVMPKSKSKKEEKTSECINLTEVGPSGPKIKLESVEAKKNLVYLRD